MEIDLESVRRFDEPAILPGQEPGHTTVIRRKVRLDLPAHLAGGILDLALRSGERVANRDQRVLVSGTSPCVRLTTMSLCWGIAIRRSTLKVSPCRCRVSGPWTTTRQLVIRPLNFSSRSTCLETSERSSSDGSQF